MFRTAVRTLPRLVRSVNILTQNVNQQITLVPRMGLVPCRNIVDMGMGANTEMEISKGVKLNDFERAKLEKKFSLYDINKDGSIKHDDYEVYISRIQKAYDLKEDDPLLHAFKNEFEAHWQRMLKFMDENKDGILSLDEWMDFYPKVTTTFKAKEFENLPQFLQTLADAFFTLMDSKKDGVVDYEEYRDFWNKWNQGQDISNQDAQAHVKHMTQDGKYPLDLPRYRDIHADFTWSKEKKTPGKYAYGPLDFE